MRWLGAFVCSAVALVALLVATSSVRMSTLAQLVLFWVVYAAAFEAGAAALRRRDDGR